MTGELDVATAPMLRDSLLALLNRGADSLVVDLRGVTFIDSTGVGSLLRIHHRQGLLGGRVHFVADQPPVLRVLDLMQLTRRLHVTADRGRGRQLLPAGPRRRPAAASVAAGSTATAAQRDGPPERNLPISAFGHAASRLRPSLVTASTVAGEDGHGHTVTPGARSSSGRPRSW